MILIFGGAYQGKLAYALDRFGLTDSDVYSCCESNTTIPINNKILYEFDKWVLALIKTDIDVTDALRQFIDNNADAIVICTDISCGVVPVDEIQRKHREAVGRSMAELSRVSNEVVRLYCGIPTRIK